MISPSHLSTPIFLLSAFAGGELSHADPVVPILIASIFITLGAALGGLLMNGSNSPLFSENSLLAFSREISATISVIPLSPFYVKATTSRALIPWPSASLSISPRPRTKSCPLVITPTKSPRFFPAPKDRVTWRSTPSLM